jgi:Ca-activated chloride channel family protein
MAPARLPDLFTGAPLLVAVRLDPAASGAILIKGQTPAGRPWSQTVPLQRSGGAAVPAIWARAHIRDLEDRYASRTGDLETLEQRIIAVSLRHRVLSRFTAFLAVDRSARVNPDGMPRMVTQAVEAPADWDMLDSCIMRSARAPAQMLVGGAPAAPATEAAPAGVARQKKLEAAPPRVRVPWNAKPAPAPAKASVRCEESESDSMQEEAAALDFAPYLQRIRDLADAVERSTASNDESGLDLAIARLRELIEDLRSVFPAAPMLEALRRAVESLQRLLGATDAVAEQGQQAAVELRALAARQGEPPDANHGSPSRAAQRWQFWKR